MDIKLIALDLDGTLLTSDKKLSDRNRRALEECIRRGIYIVPCTGRTFEGIPSPVREIEGIRYAILTNGAQIQDVKDGKVIEKRGLDWEKAVQVIDRIKDCTLMYDSYVDGRGKADRRFLDNLEYYEIRPEICRLIRETRDPIPSLREFLIAERPSLDKMNIYFKGCDRETKQKVRRELAGIQGILVTSSMPNNLEINGEGASKGNAIRILAGRLGIPVSQTMAFGDGENDKSMMEMAGIGVAMENGSPAVKACAGLTAPPNDEDGVAKVIERLILAPRQVPAETQSGAVCGPGQG